MRVKVTETNRLYFWNKGEDVPKFKYTGDIILVVDPSKSNMALLVGNTYGDILEMLEFGGFETDLKTRMNTTDYCEEFREFMIERYKNCSTVGFYQEEAIGKKGAEHFHSSMVLLEVRALLVDVAMALTGRHAVEVNNSTWKASILPRELRKRDVEKGSLIFIKRMNPVKYDKYTDDATDVMCIYLYVIKTYYKDEKIGCIASEDAKVEYKYMIVDREKYKNPGREFVYNSCFSIIENMNYVMNRIRGISYTDIEVEDFNPMEVIGHAIEVTTYSNLRLIVVPESLQAKGGI